MFFNTSAAGNALELVRFTGSHLRADYQVERPPSQITVAGHSFVRLDYVSPVTDLHWAVLATQIRCHTVQFIFTSSDPKVIEQLVAGLGSTTLPVEAGLTTGQGGGDAPLCVKDYASGANIITRVDPVITDRRFNPVPVRIVIDTGGKIKHIHFISAFTQQAQIITDALQQWRFKPYMLNGKAVEVETGLSFGRPTNKAAISGRHDPQLPPARKHDVT
jgi:hypothetical protein